MSRLLLCACALILVTMSVGCSEDDSDGQNQEAGGGVTVESSAEPSIVGTYRFYAGEGSEVDHYFVFNQDGTALIDDQPIGSEERTTVARGTWRTEGDLVVFDFGEVGGQPAPPETFIAFTLVDGFLSPSEVRVAGASFDFEQSTFDLGVGDSSLLVEALNRRLASIDYLNFTDPGTGEYGEDTRQAVVAFQEANGLVPSGAVDLETWTLLANPPTLESAPEITEVGPALEELALPSHTDDGSPIIYLTFDDGPQADSTPALLDLFDQYDAKVTFFFLGVQIQAFPEVVREATRRGHYIADHTWDHETLEGVTPERFVEEVGLTKDAIINVAGDLFSLDNDVQYVRPPYGAMDANTRSYAAELGLTVVLWSIDPQDWRRPGADVIANHVIANAYPGAVVLSHDGGGDRSQTVAAYAEILPTLQAQGYVFRHIYLP